MTLLAVIGLFFVFGFAATTNAGSANGSKSSTALMPPSAVESNVPQIKMINDNKIYNMSAFVLVNNGKLTTISLPHEAPGENGQPAPLQIGSTVSFQFDRQPATVHAFLVDYEADLPSLHALKEIKSNDFQIAGPEGLFNLEVHAFFPDGKYTSQDIMANVTAAGADRAFTRDSHSNNNDNDNANANVNTLTTKRSILHNSNSEQLLAADQGQKQQPCVESERLSTSQVVSSTQNNNDNLLGKVLADNNLATAWTTKGLDVSTFVQQQQQQQQSSARHSSDSLSNQNPWLQLDLGQDKTVCNIAISFGKGDNSVNFFKLQTSSDGVHFKDVGSAESSPVQAGALLFTFPDMPTKARYVRISDLGNLVSEEIKIAEFVAGGNNIIW